MIRTITLLLALFSSTAISPIAATECDSLQYNMLSGNNNNVTYLTGGIWSKGKKSFDPPCRIEIRVRLHGATGAWPALWMMAEDIAWPMGGEIDLLERLNHDGFIYQTVHSPYTLAGNKDNPKHYNTGAFNPDEFNTIAAEILEHEINLYVNDSLTLRYERLQPEIDGQFPFFTPQYLLMDMQLGGSWVGAINPDELPVEMEIDWVKYFRCKENHEKGTRTEWQPEWCDDFNCETLDTSTWSTIPRGTSDWNNTLSSDSGCYELRNGLLVLKGIIVHN